MDAADPLLGIEGLEVRYGKVMALSGITLQVNRGESVALLGANGAGKTSLLNAVTGFIRPSAGSIRVDGKSVGGSPPHLVFREGVAQVSQDRHLFGDMAVIDNLRLGAVVRGGDLSADLDRIFGYFPRLAERQKQRVQTLSGGEQQMVAIARALMCHPRILMLDEPSAGLAPIFVDEIIRICAILRDAGSTMLIVEQNIALAASVADRFYVLRAGLLLKRGEAAELAEDAARLAQEYYL
ncbi:MAG: ABC transporter ATP-binding protein [Acetobacteraceae bacterium]